MTRIEKKCAPIEIPAAPNVDNSKSNKIEQNRTLSSGGICCMKLDTEPLSQSHNAYASQKLACERAETLRDEEWQLHNECIALAREAIDLYKAQGEKHLRIPDLTRLIDLASRLGRLATGIPTEHIEHAWSEYQNQIWTAQFEADLKRIYGNPDDEAK
jgi:hypothetical protein